MLVLLQALFVVAPAVVDAPTEEISDRVLLLAPHAGASEGVANLGAIEAHGAGAGLTFARGDAGAAPLKVALERSREEPLLAVFWFDVTEARVALYLYSPRTHAVYVREVGRDGTTDAAVVEAVGLIAASTAAALQSGDVLAMRKISPEEWEALQPEPEPDPEPEPEPEPEPRAPAAPKRQTEAEREDERPDARLELGAGYRGASFNDQAPWQHGVGGRVGVLVGEGAVLELGYGWLSATNVASSTTLRVARHEPEVAAGWRWSFERVSLDLLGLASVEIDRWRTAERESTRARGRLGAGLRLGVPLGAGVVLEARLGARVGLNAFDFVVCDSPDAACSGDARQVVASGWRVAPGALVGVSYRFGGSSGAREK
ncbi:MAG: hypothetical protein ACE37F_19615 [Nannocystaceae bacterium]|nr:hypothetical protein [bacterium]